MATNHTIHATAKATIEGKYAIRIERTAQVTTDINVTDEDELLPVAYTNNHHVRVEQLPATGTLRIYDAVGRVVAHTDLNGEAKADYNIADSGIYILSIHANGHNHIIKLTIR